MTNSERNWLPFISGLLVFALVIISSFAGWQKENRHQPIEFNHNKHISQGLECLNCHQYFKTEPFAGFPGKEVCLGCHKEPITNSPEEEKLRVFAKEGRDIPWVSIYDQPGHVYFSHQRHVSIGKIECSTCHGQMEKLVKPPQKPAVKLTMENCIYCHQKNRVSNDCNACHR